jgi:hypothetical protein
VSYQRISYKYAHAVKYIRIQSCFKHGIFTQTTRGLKKNTFKSFAKSRSLFFSNIYRSKFESHQLLKKEARRYLFKGRVLVKFEPRSRHCSIYVTLLLVFEVLFNAYTIIRQECQLEVKIHAYDNVSSLSYKLHCFSFFPAIG